MINVSDEFEYSLSNETQNVKPNVKAWMSDIRYLENLEAKTTSHTIEKQILDRSPQVYLKLDKIRDREVASTVYTVRADPVGTGSVTPFQFQADGTYTELGFEFGEEIRVEPISPAVPLPTGLSSSTPYYVMNWGGSPGSDIVALNTNQEEAIAGTTTNAIKLPAGTHFLYFKTFESRAEDFGSSKMEIAFGTASSGDPVVDRSASFATYRTSEKAAQSLQPKRLIDTFYRSGSTSSIVDLGSFSSNASIVGPDIDSQYYSWHQNVAKWGVYNHTLYSRGLLTDSGLNDDEPRYVKTFVNSLDHFIDFKVMPDNRGATIYSRFVDDDNYVCVFVDRSSYLNPIKLIAKVGGVETWLGAADQSTFGTTFDSTHYYRFHADYNTYKLYDMGTSEPENNDTGTLMCQGYFYDEVLRSDEARWVGIGYSKLGHTWNYSITPTNFYYDYFGCYGVDYISGSYYFDGATYALARRSYSVGEVPPYAGETVLAPDNFDSQFENLNFLDNFTYQFFFTKESSGSGTQTIYWMGNPDVDALQISYIVATNKLRVKVVNYDPYTVYTLTSTETFTPGDNYHIAIVKNGTKLSLYVNGIEDSYLTLPDNFEMPNILNLTEETDSPYIMLGADAAGTRLGDSSGRHFFVGYVGEFAIFDYALSDDDVQCLYLSVENSGLVAKETVDKYCNAECAIDGLQEETFQYAFTNFLNNYGDQVYADNFSFAVSPYSIASGANSIKDNFGWMSRVESDSAGDFANPDFLKLEFDAAKCNRVFVTTGYNYGPIAEFDYEITKDDLTTISGSENFSGLSYIFIDLDDVYDIISIKITPTSTKNAYDYARLFCINPIWEVDLSDRVVNLNLDKIRDNLDSSLPIGATSANNGSITLDNTDFVFNIFGDTLYGKYANPDTIFFISLEHDLPISDGRESVKIADFVYADDWSFSNSSMTVDVSFRDYSKFLQEETVRGYIGQTITAGVGISQLAMSSGFPARRIVYQDKFFDALGKDFPSSYYRFSTADYVVGSALSEFYDVCGKGVALQEENFSISEAEVYGNPPREGSIDIAGTLIYSETVSVQDSVRRNAEAGLTTTFEPYYNSNSIKINLSDGGFSYYDGTLSFFEYVNSGTAYWCPFYYDTYSWTAEIFHFYKEEGIPDLSTAEGLAMAENFPRGNIITIIGNSTNDAQHNFHIGYSIDNENHIKYYFWLFDDSGDKYTLESDWLVASSPHIVSIRKTVGASVVFDLFVDGQVEDTMTFVGVEDVGANSTAAYLMAKPSNSYISDFVFYDYALSNDRIYEHYVASAISIMPTYRVLYGANQTYWDAMLSIATADLGMFYLDEYGNFVYEYRNTFHEELFDRYQISQYDFSDSKNIVSGEYTSQVQTNKVIVKVNNLSIKSNQDEVLWEAEDGESLAITTSTGYITPVSTSIPLSSVTDPQWTDSGYIKVDDEIMQYSAISGTSLTGLTRGLFGTKANWHQNGALVREARYYQIEYSAVPAFNVKYPLITSTEVDVDYYVSDSYYAEILISGKDTATSGSLIILQGKDPISEVDQFLEIVGKPASAESGSEFVSEESQEILSNIRKYRLKSIEIDNPYIQSKTYAKILSDYIISYYSNPVRVLKMEILGAPHIQLGDLVTIESFVDLGIANEKFWVIESSMSYDGGVQQTISLLAYSPPATSAEQKFATGTIFAI